MFITECEFNNTDMEGTASAEWRYVSAHRTAGLSSLAVCASN